MTKFYTTTNGKTVSLSTRQFRKLAESLYSAIQRNAYSAVIVLDDETNDYLVCCRKTNNFACQRRVVMNENAVNYDLPTMLFSSAFFPTMQSFINLLWCLGDCTVEVYDSDGLECKKVFNLWGA